MLVLHFFSTGCEFEILLVDHYDVGQEITEICSRERVLCDTDIETLFFFKVPTNKKNRFDGKFAVLCSMP